MLAPDIVYYFHLVDAAQGVGLVPDSDALQAAGKAVGGKGTRHLKHHRRPFVLHHGEGEGAPGGEVAVEAPAVAVAADAGVPGAPQGVLLGKQELAACLCVLHHITVLRLHLAECSSVFRMFQEYI